MFKKLAFIACIFLFGTLIQAENLDSALAEAAKFQKDSKHLEALKKLNSATESVWESMKITVPFYALVTEKPTGYGMYMPRKDNVYTKNSGEKIIIYIYMEPVGYHVERIKNEFFKFGFVIDIYIMNTKGEVLFGKEAFMKQNFMSRRFNRELFLISTVTLSNIPAGQYVLKLVTKDAISHDNTETKIPIEIK